MKDKGAWSVIRDAKTNVLMPKILEKIRDTETKVKVPKPKEAYKIRSLQIIPFLDAEEMKIGTAEVNKWKTPYVKAAGRFRWTALPRASDLMEFEKEK